LDTHLNRKNTSIRVSPTNLATCHKANRADPEHGGFLCVRRIALFGRTIQRVVGPWNGALNIQLWRSSGACVDRGTPDVAAHYHGAARLAAGVEAGSKIPLSIRRVIQCSKKRVLLRLCSESTLKDCRADPIELRPYPRDLGPLRRLPLPGGESRYRFPQVSGRS
jgi:hypothetical protein